MWQTLFCTLALPLVRVVYSAGMGWDGIGEKICCVLFFEVRACLHPCALFSLRKQSIQFRSAHFPSLPFPFSLEKDRVSGCSDEAIEFSRVCLGNYSACLLGSPPAREKVIE